MILVSIKMYTKCWLLKIFLLKVLVCFKRCFEKFVSKKLWTFYLLKRSLCSFPPPLDSAILPLIGKKFYYWMWRDGCGSLYSHRRQPMRRFSNCRDGLRSFYRRQHRRVIEGLRSCIRGSLLKYPTFEGHDYFFSLYRISLYCVVIRRVWQDLKSIARQL